MSNNRDFKVKNGIQPTSYFEGVGTVVSGSEGYSLGSASYDSKSFSVASQDQRPYGIAFNSSGAKMYILGNVNNTVYQYSLSTSFDVSTASYDSVSFSVASQSSDTYDVAFNSDGTKMYVIDITTDSVYQYTLSTAFDLATASYSSVSFSVASQGANPVGLSFNPTGTKMYVIESSTVHQYSLSTGFDLSTASYDSVSFSVSSQDSFAFALSFSNDGTKMAVNGNSSDTMYLYNLSTAFDVSTASYSSVSFGVSSQDSNPRGFAFNSNGTKLYMLGNTNDTIYQYSTVLTQQHPRPIHWFSL